jgi:HD-like signal output (HDOD) protein
MPDTLGTKLANYWNQPIEVGAELRFHHTPHTTAAAECAQFTNSFN